MKAHLRIKLLLFLLFYNLTTYGQTRKSNDYLLLFADTTNDEYGYKDYNGNIVIQPGKYDLCFTDTFRTYAIILKDSVGFIAIDRKQNTLYNVFPFDNGPDYTSEGLFRIMENNKIGYADGVTGKIVIKPQFECAFPFTKGIAKVSINCTTHSEGEHSVWASENWFYIDKRGRKINK